MQLLLIRHGRAGDRETFAQTGKDDSERPLTTPGKWKMRRIAKGLHRTVGAIDVLGSSPLVRAAQTAAIVAREFGLSDVAEVEALVPGTPAEQCAAWLRRQKAAEVVALVGHEPDLGALATWLLGGGAESRVPIGKGGACLLEIDGRVKAGGAVLRWALTPALLRRLSDC